MLNRNEAATKRVAYAIAKLDEARAKLDEACAALSSVEGASAPYKRIRRVSIDTLDLRRDVDQFLADSDSALKLDRNPKVEEEARYATDEAPEFERDSEILVWSLTAESALAFFGYSREQAKAVRVIKEAPETERERERYAPEAKLFGITIE
jgi:hypothetical protein